MITRKQNTLPSIKNEILVCSALELSQRIKNGHLKSETVVKHFIERIKEVNPILNAVIDNRYEKALKEAEEIDRKLKDARNNLGDKSLLELPLIGIPVSIKEHLPVEGCSHTAGLVREKSRIATKNTSTVDSLVKNGLIPFVVTNVPECSMWWDASNLVHGQTNNPHDLTRIPGGSSGGEAALIASAGSVVGIGTDLAGSIRTPCGFCGIFGHKPTPFIVPIDGMIPDMQNDREKLVGLGPITRFACDMKPVLNIIASPNNAHKLQLDKRVDLNQLKIFYLFELNDPMAANCNSEVVDYVQSAIDYLVNKFNITSQLTRFDAFKHGWFIWAVEASSKEDLPSIGALYKDGREGEFKLSKEIVKKIFRTSEHTFNAIMEVFYYGFTPSYGTKDHTELMEEAAALREQFNELLGDNGILLMPTHPESAPKHLTTAFKIFNTSYTCLPNILQCPVTQCPLGLSKDGLPIGVQILAKPLNDRITLAVAEELERGFGGWSRPCKVEL